MAERVSLRITPKAATGLGLEKFPHKTHQPTRRKPSKVLIETIPQRVKIASLGAETLPECTIEAPSNNRSYIICYFSNLLSGCVLAITASEE